MIDPKLINLSALPSVSLGNRKHLPQTAGIYLAIDAAETVQYIGRSVNLRQRWSSHHQSSALDIITGVRIAWFEISESSLLPQIEQALIEYFNPPFNVGCCPPKFVKSSDRPAVKHSTVKIRCWLQELLDEKEMTRSALSLQTGLTSAAIRGLCENTAKRYDVGTLAVLFSCKEDKHNLTNQ
jgi:hypothetical protein